MTEVRYNKSHHAGATPEARITNRLRNSGDVAHADVTVQKGSSPTRTYVNLHHAASHVPPPNVRDKDIKGAKR